MSTPVRARRLTEDEGHLDGDYGHRNPARAPARAIRIGRERVLVLLHAHGISFHGCYSLSEDKLWGVLHEHKAASTPSPRSRPSAPPARTARRSTSRNRHPDVIAAQRRERARVRSEQHHHRWGRPAETQAA